MGQARQDRNKALTDQIAAEVGDMETNRKYGLLGVIEYFVSDTEDPHFMNQLAYLKEHWIPDRQKQLAEEETTGAARDRASEALDRVIDFTDTLEREYKGEI